MQRSHKRPAALPRKQAAHQVRIIGGTWKRTPLPVLDAEGLRPTPDRVRETLFNWLNHLLDGSWSQVNCLDLFAGTGALGFEAASRGANSVLMVEENAAAVRQLNTIKEKLHADQVTIQRGDAQSVAQACAARGAAGTKFQVIFLDPPYHRDWLAKILPVCAQLLAPGGLVYAESEMALDPEAPPDWLAGWRAVRADKAGMVYFHLLRRNSEPEIQA
ncbi:MAG: 16S rRNA (guanine(966)-N(2))-methyltransferase RsmD [Bacillota bacterium]